VHCGVTASSQNAAMRGGYLWAAVGDPGGEAHVRGRREGPTEVARGPNGTEGRSDPLSFRS